MTFLPPLFQALLILVVSIAAATDIRSRRIPNALVSMALIFGLGLNWFGYGGPGLVHAMQGLGVALLVYVPLFIIRAVGAGDAKLMAAIGAIVGPSNWVGVFVATSLLGGLIAVVVVVARGRVKRTLSNVAYIISELTRMRSPHATRAELDVTNPSALRLPHAVSIALGAFMFICASWVWAPR